MKRGHRKTAIRRTTVRNIATAKVTGGGGNMYGSYACGYGGSGMCNTTFHQNGPSDDMAAVDLGTLQGGAVEVAPMLHKGKK